MQNHPDVCAPHEWEKIVQEMDSEMTVRQVMDRWYYYLRPGISRDEFTIRERRDCLKAWMIERGNWGEIASRLRDGHTRSCAQVKSVVTTMRAKLARLEITLMHPDAVDALPDGFFQKLAGADDIMLVRRTFLERRIATLRRQLRASREAQ
jgi:hypothetical protein